MSDTSLPVKMGNCLHVAVETVLNKQVVPCMAVHIELHNGAENDEYPILIPLNEYRAIKRIEIPKEKMGRMKQGRLYNRFIDGCNCFHILLNDPNVGKFVAEVKVEDVKHWFVNACENDSSIPKKSFLTDLLD